MNNIQIKAQALAATCRDEAYTCPLAEDPRLGMRVDYGIVCLLRGLKELSCVQVTAEAWVEVLEEYYEQPTD